ncbi:type III secretion system chaperone family protein [Leptothoe spongobia]|uniref:YbjN domain-containing protein n=1 Tax=Leptothoe spongobia TAU-MAC 1115 TaxID=1967444 RepID=A0A947DGI5_9CYAN|nr:YbjN domain-containing protein [Leptothoe spongobia]MBT9316643.1 YbjN domain-containing protein [Leptothoe spongobia TAU-MAC 1115]
MENTNQKSKNNSINFFLDSYSAISVNILESNFLDCKPFKKYRIKIECDLETYQKIKIQSLFNLNSELWIFFDESKLGNTDPIEIELLLKPQLCSKLETYTGQPEQRLAYLVSLSKSFDEQIYSFEKLGSESTKKHEPHTEENINPLLQTKNWFALSVKQKLASEETIYPTLWSYVDPSYVHPEAIADGQFHEAVIKFYEQQGKVEIAKFEQVIQEVFGIIEEELKSFDEPAFLKQTEELASDIFQEIGRAIEHWGKKPFEGTSPPLSHPIYDTVINFFSEDDWEFSKLKGESILRLAAQGKNSRFTCYAKILEKRQKFIFYSIFPASVFQTKRLQIAELLTRINHGLLVGNFELDFEAGEIFYKTSIDVKGDRLTYALIQNLVYTNVMTMDQYLPGIMAVLEQDTSPEQAIHLVEQGEATQEPQQTPATSLNPMERLVW